MDPRMGAISAIPRLAMELKNPSSAVLSSGARPFAYTSLKTIGKNATMMPSVYAEFPASISAHDQIVRRLPGDVRAAMPGYTTSGTVRLCLVHHALALGPEVDPQRPLSTPGREH